MSTKPRKQQVSRKPKSSVVALNKGVSAPAKKPPEPVELITTEPPPQALATMSPDLLSRMRNISQSVERGRGELADLAEALSNVTEQIAIRGKAIRELRAALDVCRKEACTATGLEVEANYRISLATGEIFPG